MINYRKQYSGVIISGYVLGVGLVTQGVLNDDIGMIKIFSILVVMSLPSCFEFFKARKEKPRAFRVLLSLTVAAIIIGAVFDSGFLSGLFAFTGMWPVHILHEGGEGRRRENSGV